MTSKLYKKSDYPELARWWREAWCPIPHESQLDTIGYIGYYRDVPLCAVFAYRCKDVPVAWLEHFITNPDCESAMDKMRAVRAMMDSMLTQLADEGYAMVRGVTWSETLGKVCNRQWGFEIIDKECTNMSLMLN